MSKPFWKSFYAGIRKCKHKKGYYVAEYTDTGELNERYCYTFATQAKAKKYLKVFTMLQKKFKKDANFTSIVAKHYIDGNAYIAKDYKVVRDMFSYLT